MSGNRTHNAHRAACAFARVFGSLCFDQQTIGRIGDVYVVTRDDGLVFETDGQDEFSPVRCISPTERS